MNLLHFVESTALHGHAAPHAVKPQRERGSHESHDCSATEVLEASKRYRRFESNLMLPSLSLAGKDKNPQARDYADRAACRK